MPKDPSPLLGYNNNIRHKDRVFHVQTEDSGVRHPHIITHLFMDGGRILKSVKTSYVEHLGAEKMADMVRVMMKDQHKAMLIALRDGQFDQLLEDAQAGKPKPVAAPPAPAPAPAAAAKAPDAAPSRAPVVPPPVAESASKPTAKPASGATFPVAGFDEAPPTTRMGPEEARAAFERVDIGALERAAAQDEESFQQPQSDLPPPPANLFRAKEPATGGYRTLSPPPSLDEVRPPPSVRRPPSVPPLARRSPSAPPPPARRTSSIPPRERTPIPPRPDRRTEKAAPVARPPTGASPKPGPTRPAAGSGASSPAADARYAPARPAGIFGQARPKRGASIFGEDLISDKSLDEVILSYLAEDLEAAPGDKKKK